MAPNYNKTNDGGNSYYYHRTRSEEIFHINRKYKKYYKLHQQRQQEGGGGEFYQELHGQGEREAGRTETQSRTNLSASSLTYSNSSSSIPFDIDSERPHQQPRQNQQKQQDEYEDDDDDDDEFFDHHEVRRRYKQHKVWKARWLLIASAMIYGSSFPMIKWLNQQVPVAVHLPIRFGLACIITLPWLFTNTSRNYSNNNNGGDDLTFFQRRKLRYDTCMSILRGFEVGVWNVLGFLSQGVGLETTAASKSSFIFSLAVIVVPLLDYTFLGKIIPCRQWMGAMLAVAGCACLEFWHPNNDRNSNDGTMSTTSNNNDVWNNDLTSYLQPVAFGIAYWRMEHAVHKYPNHAARINSALILSLFISSLLFLAWSNHTVNDNDPTMMDTNYANQQEAASSSLLYALEWHSWYTNWKLVIVMIYTGCITIAFTNYMEIVALQTVSATEATLILSVEPIFGTLFTALSLILVTTPTTTTTGNNSNDDDDDDEGKEMLGVPFWVGAILILSACIYSNIGWNGVQKVIRYCCCSCCGGGKANGRNFASTRLKDTQSNHHEHNENDFCQKHQESHNKYLFFLHMFSSHDNENNNNNDSMSLASFTSSSHHDTMLV